MLIVNREAAPETLKLGKPFKYLKSFTNILICNQDGVLRHDGSVRMYMDPRGDIGFAVGLPEWLNAALSDRHIQRDKNSGEEFVWGETAQKALNEAVAKYKAYNLSMKMAVRTEVIVVSFSGKGALLDETGKERPPTPQEIGSGRFGRGIVPHAHGATAELSFRRGWQADGRFYIEVNGVMKQEGFSGHVIPFAQETWDQLVSIRMTLSKAVNALHGIFGGEDANAIPDLLRASPLLLPQPIKKPKPEAEWKPATKVVRRSK